MVTSQLIRSPLLAALIMERAEAALRAKYPELYYEPAIQAPEIDRDLTDAEEEYRMGLWDMARMAHDEALVHWHRQRTAQLDLEFVRAYRRYLTSSVALDRFVAREQRVERQARYRSSTDTNRDWWDDVLNHRAVAVGVGQWLTRQLKRGATTRLEARIFLFMMLEEAVIGSEGIPEGDARGAESLQEYVDHSMHRFESTERATVAA